MADVIVVGGGISGLSLAWKAASQGKKAVVLEREQRVGGCVHTHRTADGYWLELGTHTTYNSYGGFLDVVVGTGSAGAIVERGDARKVFALLRDHQLKYLTPLKVLRELSWLEAAVHLPLGLARKKEGETVYSYYSHLLGRRNYDRLLSAFFAAVPCQKADGFPLTGPGSLFKKRSRRPEFPRTFGIRGGLQTVCDAAAAAPGVTVERGVAAARIVRSGGGFVVTAADGRRFEAPRCAVAAPPDQAAALLHDDFHELSTVISRVATVSVETMAVVVPAARCPVHPCAFLIPVDDAFFSAVTRDPFPDPERRAFSFHFKPGSPRDAKLARIAEVLGMKREDLGEPVETRRTLPAPALGHAEIVAAVDRCVAGGKLAVTGNYFAGLSLEDCITRSNQEWARISG